MEDTNTRTFWALSVLGAFEKKKKTEAYQGVFIYTCLPFQELLFSFATLAINVIWAADLKIEFKFNFKTGPQLCKNNNA